MAEHTTFTPGATAYLRNLNQEDLTENCFAVHYQAAPKKTNEGTIISLRFPLLLVSAYFGNQEEIAAKVARILEKHWNDPDDAPAAAAAREVVNG